MSDLNQRLSQANQAIGIAASCGRRFFHSKSDSRNGELRLAGGPAIVAQPADDHATPALINVLYIDPDTGQHTLVSDHAEWSEFVAPPARRLLLAMADYVRTGRKVSLELIAPPYQTLSGNMWNYDEESAEKVRALCSVLPMIGRSV